MQERMVKEAKLVMFAQEGKVKLGCEQLREEISQYINHTASEEEARLLEEHLCICNSCRQFLSEHLDKVKKTHIKKDDTTIIKRINLWEAIVLTIGIITLLIFIRLLFST